MLASLITTATLQEDVDAVFIRTAEPNPVNPQWLDCWINELREALKNVDIDLMILDMSGFYPNKDLLEALCTVHNTAKTLSKMVNFIRVNESLERRIEEIIPYSAFFTPASKKEESLHMLQPSS